MDIEEIIINLKLLNKVEKNQKIITRGEYLNVEPKTIIPECIRRWNRQDSRHETLRKINSIIDVAIKIIDDPKYKDFNIRKYLLESKTGISNLKETYCLCNQTCSRLDIIIDKINTKLGIEINKTDDIMEEIDY
jgi:hypothetical protein